MRKALPRISAFVKALLVAALLACALVPLPGCSAASSPVAQVALAEYETYAENRGEKYWSWMGFSSRQPWCACFASWCADQAGLVAEGYAPRNAGVLGWIQFYKDNPEAGMLVSGDSAYIPSSGDFIIWQRSLDPDAAIESHIGIVESYDAATGTVYTIEGNSGDSLRRNAHQAGSGISFYAVPAASGSYSGLAGCSAALGGDTTVLPGGLGDVHTYMGWQLVTSKTSVQYKLRQMAGENYDAEGFAKIGSRYVVACTETYGSVGDYINVTQTDGRVIECIIGDIKSQSDAGCNKWGHQDGNCVIEFVVDCAKWYDASWSRGTHVNPGTASFHPEWDCDIASITNLGSFFDGAAPGSSGAAAFGLYGCSSVAPSSGSGANGLQGIEGEIAAKLLTSGFGKTQAAAMLAVLGQTQGLSEESWTNVDGQVAQVVRAYRAWAPTERLSFEGITDAGQAAEALGRGFAGLPDTGTDWAALRASAVSYQSRM